MGAGDQSAAAPDAGHRRRAAWRARRRPEACAPSCKTCSVPAASSLMGVHDRSPPTCDDGLAARGAAIKVPGAPVDIAVVDIEGGHSDQQPRTTPRRARTRALLCSNRVGHFVGTTRARLLGRAVAGVTVVAALAAGRLRPRRCHRVGSGPRAVTAHAHLDARPSTTPAARSPLSSPNVANLAGGPAVGRRRPRRARVRLQPGLRRGGAGMAGEHGGVPVDSTPSVADVTGSGARLGVRGRGQRRYARPRAGTWPSRPRAPPSGSPTCQNPVDRHQPGQGRAGVDGGGQPRKAAPTWWPARSVRWPRP